MRYSQNNDDYFIAVLFGDQIYFGFTDCFFMSLKRNPIKSVFSTTGLWIESKFLYEKGTVFVEYSRKQFSIFFTLSKYF